MNFATDKNNAGITIGPDNVLIIFGNLEMGKNNAGVDIAAGGVLVVTGNITASGNNGEITGDGNYYTNGSTSGMANNSSNPEGTEDDLSNDGYSSIEEFVKGGGATPLPVTLTYFKAEAKSAVLLTWATSTEINNNYFVVQRSEDGSYFYEVGRVDGHGNSKQTIEYQFEDHSHFAPVAYYRLKQVDYDGAYEYSPVQRVEIRTQGTQRTVNIFPYEVANGRLTVQSNQPLILQQRVIYSTSGARYTQVPTLQLSNAHGVELNVDNLPAGLYILRLITSEGQKVTGNFLVP